MAKLIQEFIFDAARVRPAAPALRHQGVNHSYAALAQDLGQAGSALRAIGVQRNACVAVWLPTGLQAVVALFGAACAGCTMVPLDPRADAARIAMQLAGTGSSVLFTTTAHMSELAAVGIDLPHLRTVVLCGADGCTPAAAPNGALLMHWDEFVALDAPAEHGDKVGADVAVLLHTEAGAGRPDPVALSHRDLVAAADSSVRYLAIDARDRLLAALPLSVDYGLNQLTSAFAAGALVVLLDAPDPDRIVLTVRDEHVTALAGTPALWAELAQRDWSHAGASLRYLTSAGGPVARPLLDQLRRALPRTRIHLMYGLAEAFRSTCLAPELSFGARDEDCIRTSGHRVDPADVEQAVYDTGLVQEAAVVGVAHPVRGQVIAVLARPRAGCRLDSAIVFDACQARLPGHMLPAMVDVRRTPLPRAANGGIDRALLAGELAPLFAEATP
jgi:acyl-CoA synthetase (AMP-forming)/AMP-acid ligase II